MALPNSINPNTPLGSDLKKFGDDQIRGLKQAVIDIFGLPPAIPITAAPFQIGTDGSISGLQRILTPVRINASVDPFVTLGLVVDQGANDDLIASFQSTGDVTQPVTNAFTASTFGALGKVSSTIGGLAIYGLTDAPSAPALLLNGLQSVGNTVKNSTATPSVLVAGHKSDGGTGATVLSGTDNLFGVSNGTGNVVMLVDANGALRVRPGVAGVTPSTFYDDFIVEGPPGVTMGMSFLTPTNTRTQTIAFGDPQNPAIGTFSYDHAVDKFFMVVNTDTVLGFDQSTFSIEASGDTLLHAEDGKLFVGTLTNSFMVRGFTLDMENVGNTEGIALQHNSSNHGMTSIADTNTFFSVRWGALSPAEIHGYGNSFTGLEMRGHAVNTDTQRSINAVAPTTFRSYIRSGTGIANLGTNVNLVVYNNGNQARVIIDSDGDIHVDGASSLQTYDDYDDVKLLTAARASLMPKSDFKTRYANWIEQYAPVLAQGGVITYNEDGHHFVSHKGMTGLLIDTIRQLADRIERLENAGTAR